jgi:hypothetical protein
MGCCNELASVLETTVFDPTRHVNFAKGMVLGVDDFRQEFAYLAGRDQWLARDAIGYGTLSGLRVFAESSGVEGPRLHVTAGTALVPSGKLVCVGADQCAILNKWLAKPANAAIVTQLLNPESPPGSPPFSPPLSPPDVTSGAIALYLTLCYADCTAYPVPVPGEPCRTEDELMADSRVVDDFRLELRKDPPAQVEEDALRDFVKWLRESIQVVTTGSPSTIDENAWLEALRPAAQPWLDAAAMSPPLTPPASFETLGDYLFTLSPPTIEVAQDQLCAFLRVAFRFWVTELRPLWMARRCHLPMVKDQDCVLLARIEFEVEFVGGSPTGAWVVTGSPATVVINETRRPFLVHLRMLQEWTMCGCECTGLGALSGIGGGGGSGGGGGGGGGSPLFFGGPVPVPFARLNASTTLGNLHHIVLAEGAAGPMRLTLPSAGPGNTGRVYVIRNVDVANLSANVPAGSRDRIEASASLAIARNRAVTLVADGAGTWRVVNRTQ